MLKRAALVAALLAPTLPAATWAQTPQAPTADRAAALQQQIQNWLQSTVGIGVTITRSPVQITAAGDHYDLTMPLAAAPDAPTMTGKMTDAGGGRWAVDDVRIPSPSVFRYQLPPSKKPGALAGEITSTLTLGDQNQRLLLDPTLATPSTWTSAVKDVAITTVAPSLTQLSHIDSMIGASTMTPASDGRVNIATNSSLDGYSLKMSGQNDPEPVSIAMGKISLVANALGVSRDRGLELIHTLSKASVQTQPPGATASPPQLDRETSMALIDALADLAKGVSIDEKVSDFSLTMQGMTGSLKLFTMGLASKADGGMLAAQLPLSAEGLTLPDLGLGDTVKLIPTKLSLTPSIGNVPTAALVQIAKKLADKQTPTDSDNAALFSQGPITAGIDSFMLDVAGSSFTGSIKVLASSPATFSGTGQITADNIDRLQQAMSADPVAAQMAPLLIFLKGVGRAEQNRLVWDIVYRDNHVLVNGQDMTALAGAAGSAQSDTPAARPPKQGAAPTRPAQRPNPKQP